MARMQEVLPMPAGPARRRCGRLRFLTYASRRANASLWPMTSLSLRGRYFSSHGWNSSLLTEGFSAARLFKPAPAAKWPISLRELDVDFYFLLVVRWQEREGVDGFGRAELEWQRQGVPLAVVPFLGGIEHVLAGRRAGDDNVLDALPLLACDFQVKRVAGREVRIAKADGHH